MGDKKSKTASKETDDGAAVSMVQMILSDEISESEASHFQADTAKHESI